MPIRSGILSFNEAIKWVGDFVSQNESWAIITIFFLSLGESLVFLSLLLPATLILLVLGALVSKSGISFWVVWVAATSGAFFGDWISYWIGYKYHHSIIGMWPFSCNASLLNRGHVLFERWGVIGVFMGRFFGPLRAVIPLVSGICGMPQINFQLANIISAMIWAFTVLAPGSFGITWLKHWLS